MTRLLATLCCVALTTSALAQTAPTPSGPFPAPVTGYVGRYLDSSTTPDFQCCPRTYRARWTKIAPERDAIYMVIGSTFVRQTLSTFLDRVRNESMVTLSGAGVFRGASPGEKYLVFNDWVDPERSNGEWSTPLVDGQDRLFDFDQDDRGSLYLAYSVFGLGIVDTNLDLEHQLTNVFPIQVFTFRNGNSQYVQVGDSEGNSQIYDVTTPSNPVYVRVGSPFLRWARANNGHVALSSPTSITIHTPPSLVSGGAAIYTLQHAVGAAFRDITTDGTRFYALEATGSGGTIHILTPSGSTYVDTTVAAPANFNTTINYGVRYLVAGSTSPRRAAIYSTVTGTPVLQGELAIDYFTQNNVPTNFLPATIGNETVLFVASKGVGDVFSLATQPATLTIAQQFSPASVLLDAESQLTITIANPTASPLPTFDLSDALPSALENTSTPASTTCGGSLIATPGTSSFTLTGGAIDANASCTITLNLSASTAGAFTNEIPAYAITSAASTNAASSSATLTIVGPPAWVTATATSTSHVDVSWAAVEGATSYQVYRSTLNSAFTLLTTTASTSSPDDSLIANRTYLYRVRSLIGASGTALSTVDAATTIVFTDAALTGTVVKATHVNELRTAVNAMRAAGGLAAATFTQDPLTAQSARIKAVHVDELRTALDAARSAIGLAALTYTDATITPDATTVKAAHLTELRSGTQ